MQTEEQNFGTQDVRQMDAPAAAGGDDWGNM